MSDLNDFLKRIKNFYLKDMCWPYSLSFALTLVIYFVEFVFSRSIGLASIIAYFVLFAYYIKNLKLYKNKELKVQDPDFFILFLTAKIIAWTAILIALVLLAWAL